MGGIFEDIGERIPYFARRAQDVVVVAVGKQLTHAAPEVVEALGDADREGLHAPAKPILFGECVGNAQPNGERLEVGASPRTSTSFQNHRPPRRLCAAVGDDSLRAAWRGALRAASLSHSHSGAAPSAADSARAPAQSRRRARGVYVRSRVQALAARDFIVTHCPHLEEVRDSRGWAESRKEIANLIGQIARRACVESRA